MSANDRPRYTQLGYETKLSIMHRVSMITSFKRDSIGLLEVTYTRFTNKYNEKKYHYCTWAAFQVGGKGFTCNLISGEWDRDREYDK